MKSDEGVSANERARLLARADPAVVSEALIRPGFARPPSPRGRRGRLPRDLCESRRIKSGGSDLGERRALYVLLDRYAARARLKGRTSLDALMAARDDGAALSNEASGRACLAVSGRDEFPRGGIAICAGEATLRALARRRANA